MSAQIYAQDEKSREGTTARCTNTGKTFDFVSSKIYVHKYLRSTVPVSCFLCKMVVVALHFIHSLFDGNIYVYCIRSSIKRNTHLTGYAKKTDQQAKQKRYTALLLGLSITNQ